MRSSCVFPSFIAAILFTFAISLNATEDVLRIDKRIYKLDATYSDIQGDPDRFIKRDLSKRSIKVTATGYVSKISLPYEKFSYIKNMQQLKFDGGTNDLPIFFNPKDKIKRLIYSIEQSQNFTLYVTLKSEKEESKDPKAKASAKLYFYLIVDDLELNTDTTKNTPGSSKSGTASVASDPADNAQPEEVKFRRLDVQPKQYLNKKVKLSVTFKDISSTIPGPILKYSEITGDDYMVLLISQAFQMPIIVSRTDENCAQTIIDAEGGAAMTVYGTVKYAGDPADKKTKPLYYILAYSILPDSSSAASTNTGSAESSPKGTPSSSVPSANTASDSSTGNAADTNSTAAPSQPEPAAKKILPPPSSIFN